MKMCKKNENVYKQLTETRNRTITETWTKNYKMIKSSTCNEWPKLYMAAESIQGRSNENINAMKNGHGRDKEKEK